jgi:proton-coupled amino acid transporter
LKRSLIKATAYLDTHIYGEPAREDSDEEEKDNPDLVGKTPNTRKRLIREKATDEVVKLGPLGTAFTLFKGIVASGILYLPTAFVTGGWLFSGVALCSSLALTLYCIKLLLDVRAKLGGNVSFPEIGFLTFGRTGKILVDVSLFFSQVGFVCAYIYFIASQVTAVLDSAFGIEIPMEYKWVYAPICFAILFPMVMVRKI